jgi:hypothetical protein
VREVAGDNDQLRVGALDQRAKGALDLGLLDGSDMQVREVKEPYGHRRRRLVH